jgi:hypothetical protein
MEFEIRLDSAAALKRIRKMRFYKKFSFLNENF